MCRGWSSRVPRVGFEAPGIELNEGNQHTLAVHVDRSSMEVWEAIWGNQDGGDRGS